MSTSNTPTPAPKAFEITFTGRKVGAIGKTYEITASRFAQTPEEAIRLLYEPMPEAYEHIMHPEVREVPSPFGWQQLYNHVTNTRESLDQFSHWARMMTSEMSRVARRCAKEAKDWHDDPEAPEHALYHAPADQVFPAEQQLIAIAEVMTYLLRETPAGLRVYDRLNLPDDPPFRPAPVVVSEKGGS